MWSVESSLAGEYSMNRSYILVGRRIVGLAVTRGREEGRQGFVRVLLMIHSLLPQRSNTQPGDWLIEAHEAVLVGWREAEGLRG